MERLGEKEEREEWEDREMKPNPRGRQEDNE